MIMEFEIPRAGIKSYTCRRHTSIHSPIYALIPSSRKILGPSVYIRDIKVKLTGYIQDIYRHAVSLNTDKSLFQEVTEKMAENVREEGE